MVNVQFLNKIQHELLNRREVLEETRREMDMSRKRLSEAQVELEENAQQEKMQQELEEQDRVIRDELYQVNMALQRIEAGTFGLCHECGDEIAEARLRAMPGTIFCIECAREQEGYEPREFPENQETAPPMTETYEGLSDDELCSAIIEHLRYQDVVELDDLDIQCSGRKVAVSGVLPSRERNEVLHEVIEDTFGVHEFENNVRIDPRAWERTDRTPDEQLPPRNQEEELLEGETEESDS